MRRNLILVTGLLVGLFAFGAITPKASAQFLIRVPNVFVPMVRSTGIGNNSPGYTYNYYPRYSTSYPAYSYYYPAPVYYPSTGVAAGTTTTWSSGYTPSETTVTGTEVTAGTPVYYSTPTYWDSGYYYNYPTYYRRGLIFRRW